jgi:hypothetical protein
VFTGCLTDDADARIQSQIPESDKHGDRGRAGVSPLYVYTFFPYARVDGKTKGGVRRFETQDSGLVCA